MTGTVVISALCISLGLPAFLLSFFNPQNLIKDIGLRRALMLVGFLILMIGISLFQFALQNGG